MTDLRFYNRSFLRDFIHMYRNLPVLWNKNDKYYGNENARFAAYADLHVKLLEADKDASIETVRNKLGNMRANFRFELKKIDAALDEGKEYIPKLWYFKELLFLTDKEIPKTVLNKVPPIDYEEVDATSLRLCNKEFVKEFLKLYRQHECLWKVQSKNYKNKKMKANALESLRKFYSQCNQNVTINGIKNKINSFRASFRNELKKLKTSKRKYKPSLYYFKDMMFLKDIDSDRYGYKKYEAFLNNDSSSESSEFKEFENIDFENFLKKPITDSIPNDVQDDFIEEIEITTEVDDDIIGHVPIDDTNLFIEIMDDDNTTQDLYQFENNDFQLNSFETVSEESQTHISEEQSIPVDDENLLDNSKEINENSETIKNFGSSEIEIDRTIESPEILEINGEYDQLDERLSNNSSLKSYSNVDDCNAYANYIISELKMLQSDERIFVKKIFSDILFEAKLGNIKYTKLISNTKFQKQINSKNIELDWRSNKKEVVQQ